MENDCKASEIKRLTTELERAYRCIQGLYHAAGDGAHVPDNIKTYHCMTIGAAKRFVFDESLDGAEYFLGRQLDVLHAALRLPAGRKEPADEHAEAPAA
jgi:hypothetical protein